MINKVKDGIVAALAAEFPNTPVYDEAEEQGIVEPSFSVRCVEPTQRLFRGKRYYQNDLFEVVYFPPETDRYKTSNDVVQRLFNCLEIITLTDGKIRGRDMRSNTLEDHTVVFTVRYSDFVYKAGETQDLMESIEEVTVDAD